jgi:hypothetical protein
VAVTRCNDQSKAQEWLAAWLRNEHQAAVIEWGQDLEGNQLLDQTRPSVQAVDNGRVRKALGLPVRYFECDDDGCQ